MEIKTGETSFSGTESKNSFSRSEIKFKIDRLENFLIDFEFGQGQKYVTTCDVKDMIVTLCFPGFFPSYFFFWPTHCSSNDKELPVGLFLFFSLLLVVTCSIYVIFSGPICLWTELAGSNAWLTRYIFWVQAVVIRPLKVDENEGNVRIGATQTPHCGRNYQILTDIFKVFSNYEFELKFPKPN